MKMENIPWIAFFILAYCLWNSGDMFIFWQGHFWTDASLICFLIWLSPLLWRRSYPNPVFLFIALVLTFLGNLGEVHILQNLALGFAIGSFYPISWLSVLWIFSSIGWAPSFAWVAFQFTLQIQLLRIVVVIIPVLGLMCRALYQRRARHET